MKTVFVFVLAILFSPYSLAQYKCVYENGSSVEMKFPCDPATIEKFGSRFTALYPDARTSVPTHEVMKNMYVFATASCDEPFVSMSPEEFGKNMEPFFSWQMGAAMAKAARETICPRSK